MKTPAIILRLLAILVMAMAFASCSGERGAPVYHADKDPERLSDWNIIVIKNGALNINEGVTPYDLATPLFSDYALKLRTVWTPDGEPARYNPDAVFDFPVGAIFTKTFYYPIDGEEWSGAVRIGEAPSLQNRSLPITGYRLLETRILVRRHDGWAALAYVWNDDQSEAYLKRTGEILPLALRRNNNQIESFAYLVPNVNQCAGCHGVDSNSKAIEPIGPKARHLNKPSRFEPGFNQLDYWLAAGLIAGEVESPAGKSADWRDETAPLEARARAYLDINCAHCHNPTGPADTSGLDLTPPASGAKLGRCKSPIAAGGGSGGRPFDITPGAPEKSITLFRMETNDPGAMMPELGRAVTHREGVKLIADWIAAMQGDCV